MTDNELAYWKLHYHGLALMKESSDVMQRYLLAMRIEKPRASSLFAIAEYLQEESSKKLKEANEFRQKHIDSVSDNPQTLKDDLAEK